ncbi:MAG TPA: patatin-like phospholipase family protein [Thermoanaerobaculia bacterium]|nr:patatin-like phospholipase family protein [Thermoanaerobaculia bacterium]
MTMDFRATQRTAAAGENDLAVMLTGGGARAAYQVGLLRGIARHFPHLRIQIVTGVSAGAINAVFLASRRGSLAQKVEDLTNMWCELQCSSIWHFDWTKLIPFRSALSSVFWKHHWSRPGGFVDTKPLSELLHRVFDASPREPIGGIIENLHDDDIKAVAIITLDYSTGQSVRWVQGRRVDYFEGPNRRSAAAQLTVEHVMASSALPFFFPAVKIGSQWHGDGGIRLAAPLSAAVHLGASRVIAMSTGYQRTMDEASTPVVSGYPPAAQVLGQLFSAVFLDAIDEDVVRMERMNEMLRKIEPRERNGLRPIDLLVLRPSRDLGRIAGEYEHLLPRDLKLLTHALGAKETESPDFVSLLMFEPHYTKRLVEIGEKDVDERLPEIRDFLGENEPQAAAM